MFPQGRSHIIHLAGDLSNQLACRSVTFTTELRYGTKDTTAVPIFRNEKRIKANGASVEQGERRRNPRQTWRNTAFYGGMAGISGEVFPFEWGNGPKCWTNGRFQSRRGCLKRCTVRRHSRDTCIRGKLTPSRFGEPGFSDWHSPHSLIIVSIVLSPPLLRRC